MKSIHYIFCTLSIMLLSACNSDGTTTELPRLSSSGLTKVGSEAGFKQQVSAGFATWRQRRIDMLAEVASTNSIPYSDTNLIEQAADEGDYIKYDGEYLLMVEKPRIDYSIWAALTDSVSTIASPEHPQKIRIFKTNTQDPSVALTQEIVWQDASDYADIQGLYLLPRAGDAPRRFLLWIKHNKDITMTDTSGGTWRYDGSSEYVVYTQNEMGQFAESARLAIAGYDKDSRIINNRLITVHVGLPNTPALYHLSTEEIQAKIQHAPIGELLPGIIINHGIRQHAFVAGDCYLPNLTQEDTFTPSLFYITSIALDNVQDHQSICVFSETSDFYASANGVFVNSYHGNHSRVHYIDIRNARMQYRGSAEVPGSIGMGHFFMSEYKNVLRVISRVWPAPTAQENLRHHLTLFALDNIQKGVLTKLAELPNEQRPQAIGKAGEDIYAVRFMQDKAFVVTFRRTDPFYVIDMSNPRDPHITGELEVPGFSTLLQPLSDTLVLGVGYETESRWKTKVELFDIADVSAPQSRGVHIIEQQHATTEAEWNHHALTVLTEPGQDMMRIALPISYYRVEDEQDIWQRQHSLTLFEVSKATTQLRYQGELLATQRDEPYYVSYARAVIHGQHLYYIADGHVWSAYWQTPQALWEIDR